LLAYGFLRKVFEVFEKYRTPIDMITTSEVAVSLTIDNDTHLKEIIKELSVFSSASFEQGQSIISIVGNEVAEDGGSLKKLFDSLSEVKVRMVSYGGSTHNISLLVPGEEKKKVLQLLNKGLFGL
jgi:aspartate kinase